MLLHHLLLQASERMRSLNPLGRIDHDLGLLQISSRGWLLSSGLDGLLHIRCMGGLLLLEHGLHHVVVDALPGDSDQLIDLVIGDPIHARDEELLADVLTDFELLP